VNYPFNAIDFDLLRLLLNKISLNFELYNFTGIVYALTATLHTNLSLKNGIARNGTFTFYFNLFEQNFQTDS